ncbi:MAG: HNH endonuclease signature motif containing protein, partial [Corynebacterium glucuronolyticum]|nr:HNH endonuclease signature motif containing protein [Corynebacterium glucuronolyticum]
FAGPFDRRIQKAKTPVCAVEGCACGADKCQMHHIESWASGGPTTLENLANELVQTYMGVPAQGVPPVARGTLVAIVSGKGGGTNGIQPYDDC